MCAQKVKNDKKSTSSPVQSMQCKEEGRIDVVTHKRKEAEGRFSQFAQLKVVVVEWCDELPKMWASDGGIGVVDFSGSAAVDVGAGDCPG